MLLKIRNVVVLLLGLQCAFHVDAKELSEPYKSVKLLPEFLHGWFGKVNQEYLRAFIVKYQPTVIVELGSWFGESAIYMGSQLKESGTVYAIDSWVGQGVNIDDDVASKIPTIYQQFLSNVIHHDIAHKIIPIRMRTQEAAKALNIKADLIYIDASHDEESVFNDIINWYPKLNANAIICGDDWDWESVEKGVRRAAEILNRNVKGEKSFWYFEPLDTGK